MLELLYALGMWFFGVGLFTGELVKPAVEHIVDGIQKWRVTR